MASVSELLQAADAEKSPFLSLLEGLTSGIGQGFAAAPARNEALARTAQIQAQTTQMAAQAAREKAMNDQVSQLLAGQTNAAVTNGFNAVGAPTTPATPGLRLAAITSDDKGYLKPKFETVPPKALQSKDYQDDQGVNRLGSFDPMTGELIQSPDDPLAPKPAEAATADERDLHFKQTEFDKILTENDPMDASGRSGTGRLGQANLQTKLALSTLNSPTVTKGDLGNILGQISAMYQGGASSVSMPQAAYSTVAGNLAGAMQQLTGNPTDAVPDAIKQHLRDVLTNIGATNSAIIKSQLDSVEVGHKKLIDWAGDDWTDWRTNKENSLSVAPPAAPAAPAAASPAAPAPDGTHPLVGTKIGNFTVTAVNN